MEDQRGALHVDINGVPHRAGNAWETCRTGGRCHNELPDGPQGDHQYKIWSYSLLSAGSDFRMDRFWPLFCLSPVTLADSPWFLLILAGSGQYRQRLYLTPWHSQTPSASVGSTQVSALKGRNLLHSQLIYQLIVKLLQEFNFLICFDFQNFDSIFQTNFGRMFKRTSQSALHVPPEPELMLKQR